MYSNGPLHMAKQRRPARTYTQQLCEDTGCSLEELPEAMNDREKRRERVRDIHASGMTWWWFYLRSKLLYNLPMSIHGYVLLAGGHVIFRCLCFVPHFYVSIYLEKAKRQMMWERTGTKNTIKTKLYKQIQIYISTIRAMKHSKTLLVF